MPDFLEEKRKEISARLKELRPLVDEYARLEAAEQALSGVGRWQRPPRREPCPVRAEAHPPRQEQQRHRPSRPSARQRHPRDPGARAGEGPPRHHHPELAEAMGMKQNYLYRVMPGLAEEGKVTKSGRGWHSREGE